jgi:hypothetical protein
MPATVTLTHPIQAHGEEVRSLTLRDPTGKDIRTLGYPFVITKDGETRPEAAVIAKYIVNLAAIPSSSVDQMSPLDTMAALEAVMSFFGTAKAG